MCPVLALSGYLCPTCGGLRAVHDLATGDLAGAWVMNPLVTIAVPLASVVLGVWWWRAWRRLPATEVPLPVIVMITVGIVIFGVARNFI